MRHKSLRVVVFIDIRFDLHRYEICKVKFFSADGKTEYRQLRKNILKGETLKLPSVSSDDGYQFKGWSRKEVWKHFRYLEQRMECIWLTQ